MLPKKFWDKVDKVGNCWEWIAAKDSKGYGQFWYHGKLQLAYRVSYEDLNGIVPKGLELDHLCRNRKCVNPDHLEAVTHQENMKRGIPYRIKLTHCPRRHEYTEENTYINPNGSRECRNCRRISIYQFRQRKKSNLNSS